VDTSLRTSSIPLKVKFHLFTFLLVDIEVIAFSTAAADSAADSDDDDDDDGFQCTSCTVYSRCKV